MKDSSIFTILGVSKQFTTDGPRTNCPLYNKALKLELFVVCMTVCKKIGGTNYLFVWQLDMNFFYVFNKPKTQVFFEIYDY